MTTPSITSGGGGATSKPALRRKRWRKAGRRLAYAGLGLLGIALVIFFLLPVWISNEQGRTYVLQQINKSMTAKVAIDDWSLGWFRGTELKNVTVTLPDGSRLLSCPRVQSELTLWGILWGHYDIGITRIDTAQLAITRYADGSTSLDTLADPHATTSGRSKIFRTLRGSLQVGSAVVTLNSAATGKSLTYTDVKAGLTIASPEAPFHIQLSAVGGGSSWSGGGEQSFALSATLPALASWPVPPWTMISDIDLAGAALPTALVCDFAGIDPRWEDSIGPVIERVHFVNRVTPPLETSMPTMELRGTNGAFVDAAMLLRAAGRGAAVTLSLPANTTAAAEEFHATAALRVSPPLVECLKHLNPLFAAIRRADSTAGGLVAIRIGELNVTAGNEQNMQAIARLALPSVELQRKGFVAELLNAGGQPPPGQPDTVTAAAEPLNVRIAGGSIAYDNYTVTCDKRQRITFSGTVGLDGRLNLLATVPSRSTGGDVLGSSRTDLPITGTIDRPVVTLPR